MTAPLPAATQNWLNLFPALNCLEGDTVARLSQTSRVVNIPAGQTIFSAGDVCQSFLLVLKGTVRVQMTSENGREIILYRVDAGETCILTTACLLGHDPYGAQGIAETPVQAVAIPASVFAQLLATSQVLRDFVFKSYAARLANLMMVIEEVAFGRLDIRLARFLQDKADANGTLALTHQQLAVELGSAREVISRQLKEYERLGLVQLNRGHVTVLDPCQLSRLCEA